MWSDPTVWQKGGFQQYLNDHGLSNNYLVDYRSANAETFDPTNPLSRIARDAIFQKIDLAIRDAAANGIVVSQVDVVGHSLGGLQARGFMQDNRFLNLIRNYNKGYFHKVITIGTPHLGSEFGPILYQSENANVKLPTKTVILKNLAGFFSSMKVGSAHLDFDPAFQKSNTGLNRLIATVAYKAHAIEARYDAPGKPVKPAWASYMSMLNASAGKDFNQNLNQILKDTTSDLIVPRYSQLGGLTDVNYYDHYNFTTHSDLGLDTDFTETTHPVIQQRVAELLLTDNQGLFLQYGFPVPKTQAVPFENKPLAINEVKSTATSSATNLKMQDIATNTNILKITSPLAASGLKNDGKDSLLLSFSFSDQSQIANSIFVIPGIGFVGMPEKAPYSTKVLLPNSINTGKLQVLCLANDRNGNIYADTVSIKINGTDTLKSISVNNSDIKLDSLVRTNQITVNGLYINKKNNISRDISLGQTGTTYTTLSKSAVVNVSSDGLISALKAGKDTVLVKNGNLGTKVAVTVDPNLFLVKKFPNTISFSVSDKITTDPPFALTGTVTSGDAINYSVISGPLTISNGIATITGAGSVNVLASSSSTAYFSAAPNDLITFTIKKADQTINFNPLTIAKIGVDDIDPLAGSTSGLIISYASSNTAVATIVNSKIHIVGSGTTIITAAQVGNGNFNAAPSVVQQLTVQKADQVITFNAMNAVAVTTTDFTPIATNTSGLAIVFTSSNNAVATIVNNKVHIIGAGTTIVTATQAGNNNFNAATSIAQTLMVLPVPTISANGPTTFFTGGNLTLTANTGAGYTYIWTKDGVAISGATTASYIVSVAGSYNVSIVSGSNKVTSASIVINTLFTLPPTNFRLTITSATCKGSNNGIINISATQNLSYTATITGKGLNKAYPFTTSKDIGSLSAGTYSVCLTVSGQNDYKQCYDVVITEPKDLTVYSVVNNTDKTVDLALNGGTRYNIELNGLLYSTSSNNISLPLNEGINSLLVTTDKLCQGVVQESYHVSGKIVPYPDPFETTLNINIGKIYNTNVAVEIHAVSNGKLVYSRHYRNLSGLLQLDLNGLDKGIYALKLSLDNSEKVFKILKK